MATKLDTVVASDGKILSTKIHNSTGHMTNKKDYISISTRPVTTKIDRMLAYYKELQTSDK